MYIKYFKLYYYHLKMLLPLNAALIFSLQLFGKPPLFDRWKHSRMETGITPVTPLPVPLFGADVIVTGSRSSLLISMKWIVSQRIISSRTERPVHSLSTLKNGMNKSE